MIKHIPDKVCFPNYTIDIMMEEAEPNNPHVGSYNFGQLQLGISKQLIQHDPYDKYVFCLFLTASIFAASQLNASVFKINVLGGYWYHILQYNDMRKYVRHLSTAKNPKLTSLDAPSFKLGVIMGDPKDDSAGATLTTWERLITMRPEIALKLRPTLFLHEIMEWANSFYSMSLPHTVIQGVSEYMLFILQNNEFMT